MNAKRNATRVLIIDDHPVLRHGIAELINQEADFTICGEADEGRSAIELIEKNKPDILILDITLKGINGIEVLKNVKAQFKELKVLVLSMHDEAIYGPRALRAGACGYIMKHEATERVLAALRKIRSGELYVSQEMAAHLLNRFAGGKAVAFASPVEALSDRELEVFTLLGQGNGTRQISEKLNLSIKTIESHRAHIKEKLRLKNASELVRSAVEWVQSESLLGAEAAGKNAVALTA